MNYVIYDKTGKILRTVQCSEEHAKAQVRDNEFIIQDTANDIIQKIIDGKIVDKTPAEIEAEKPAEITFEKRQAQITNEQWQDVLDRLRAIEESK